MSREYKEVENKRISRYETSRNCDVCQAKIVTDDLDHDFGVLTDDVAESGHTLGDYHRVDDLDLCGKCKALVLTFVESLKAGATMPSEEVRILQLADGTYVKEFQVDPENDVLTLVRTQNPIEAFEWSRVNQKALKTAKGLYEGSTFIAGTLYFVGRKWP